MAKAKRSFKKPAKHLKFHDEITKRVARDPREFDLCVQAALAGLQKSNTDVLAAKNLNDNLREKESSTQPESSVETQADESEEPDRAVAIVERHKFDPDWKIDLTKLAKSGTVERIRQEEYLQNCFTRFWMNFPKQRKRAPKDAKKSFARACADGADPERIITQAHVYAMSPLGKSKFAVMPTTWLNQGRWDDDPESWQFVGDETAAETKVAHSIERAREFVERGDERIVDAREVRRIASDAQS